MNLAPIERNSLTRAVAARLSELIANGTWSPGQRMPSERVLADQLGVSRSTVRDAIAILAADNLVETQRSRGTFVKDGGS